MARLTHIFRHPIKAIGLEAVESVVLSEGQTLPGDRLWAVAHEASKYDEADGWGRCLNFVRGAGSHKLMAVKARVDGESIHLSHPDHEPLSVTPDDPAEAALLVDWLKPLCNPDRAMPVRVVKAGKQGMTDNREPFLSLLTAGSLDALSEACGRQLARERFRGNLWLDGTAPWDEFGWIGQRVALGGAVLEVAERIERCVATSVDPDTGYPDTDTLGTLESTWGHKDFGVFARVVESGPISVGDEARLI
jgi:MOSC domain-containing protein